MQKQAWALNDHTSAYATVGGRLVDRLRQQVHCRFCGGVKCKHEDWRQAEKRKNTHVAIRGLNSNWVEDWAIASQRPATSLIKKYNIVQQFHKFRISAVFNLQECGEHPFCGPEGCIFPESGFSYVPEVDLMPYDISHYNFPWPDMGTPNFDIVLRTVQIMCDHVAKGERFLVHCHAGLGRTGLMLACWMQYQFRLAPKETIQRLRLQRPGSIQTAKQVKFTCDFGAYLADLRQVFKEDEPLALHLSRQDRYLHGQEARALRYIPKVIHTILAHLLDGHEKTGPQPGTTTLNTFLATIVMYNNEGKKDPTLGFPILQNGSKRRSGGGSKSGKKEKKENKHKRGASEDEIIQVESADEGLRQSVVAMRTALDGGDLDCIKLERDGRVLGKVVIAFFCNLQVPALKSDPALANEIEAFTDRATSISGQTPFSDPSSTQTTSPNSCTTGGRPAKPFKPLGPNDSMGSTVPSSVCSPVGVKSHPHSRVRLKQLSGPPTPAMNPSRLGSRASSGQVSPANACLSPQSKMTRLPPLPSPSVPTAPVSPSNIVRTNSSQLQQPIPSTDAPSTSQSILLSKVAQKLHVQTQQASSSGRLSPNVQASVVLAAQLKGDSYHTVGVFLSSLRLLSQHLADDRQERLISAGLTILRRKKPDDEQVQFFRQCAREWGDSYFHGQDFLACPPAAGSADVYLQWVRGLYKKTTGSTGAGNDAGNDDALGGYATPPDSGSGGEEPANGMDPAAPSCGGTHAPDGTAVERRDSHMNSIVMSERSPIARSSAPSNLLGLVGPSSRPHSSDVCSGATTSPSTSSDSGGEPGENPIESPDVSPKVGPPVGRLLSQGASSQSALSAAATPLLSPASATQQPKEASARTPARSPTSPPSGTKPPSPSAHPHTIALPPSPPPCPLASQPQRCESPTCGSRPHRGVADSIAIQSVGDTQQETELIAAIRAAAEARPLNAR